MLRPMSALIFGIHDHTFRKNLFQRITYRCQKSPRIFPQINQKSFHSLFIQFTVGFLKLFRSAIGKFCNLNISKGIVKHPALYYRYFHLFQRYCDIGSRSIPFHSQNNLLFVIFPDDFGDL